MQGPILVTLASFTAYTLLGFEMTADVAFPALALFNLLRQPLQMCAFLLESCLQALCLLLGHSLQRPAC